MASKLTDAQLRDRLAGSEATARKHRAAGEVHKAIQAEDRAARMRRELELRESRRSSQPAPGGEENGSRQAAACAAAAGAAATLPQPAEMPPDRTVSAVAAILAEWGTAWTVRAFLVALREWGRTARAAECPDIAVFHQVEAIRRVAPEARP